MSSEGVDSNAAIKWAQRIVGLDSGQATLLHGDASQRLYFRLGQGVSSRIVADASAELAEVPAFIAIGKALACNTIRVPRIEAAELNRGYLLQEDFGEQLLLPLLNGDNVEHWYQQVFSILLKMQTIKQVEGHRLLTFSSHAYTHEFKIFTDWYLDKYCQATYDQDMLANVLASLIDNNLQQPQVFVHRDLHSRNLMVLADQELGLLDFQGAKWGPITYDLVSLIKDCYIDWPEPQRTAWLNQLQPKLMAQQGVADVSAEAISTMV